MRYVIVPNSNRGYTKSRNYFEIEITEKESIAGCKYRVLKRCSIEHGPIDDKTVVFHKYDDMGRSIFESYDDFIKHLAAAIIRGDV